ncbi:unnamed protein product [Fusarium equiseti]|uniref:DUF6536 domain-containing protein n=1 Tax=Fusarium equiseti TaxID=61235 RepID=A0A8J2IKH0_FUSEQ|nr:unnamed protein product [Fusarium equiseti]
MPHPTLREVKFTACNRTLATRTTMAESKSIAADVVADLNDRSEVQDTVSTSATSKRDKWQVSLIAGAGACIVVLIINLGVTIWSSVTLKGSENNESGKRSNRGIIYEGSCSASRTLNIVIHLVINIFGSILLAASNYGMQCLSAPTRADVDQAHVRKNWMDIGIPSFRNLRMVSRTRVALWLLLVLSSVPLHLLYGAAFCGSCALLIWGVVILPGPRDPKSLWDLGFGSANELTLISGLAWQNMEEKRLIANVLMANLPQLIFSFLYFQYNSVFTCMTAAAEWSGYGNKRRSLRVSSDPTGEQRSRYFLQLPYRYSIPLLLASILMHWMLSQSIFIVAVEQSGFWKEFTCGYSPITIIFVIITAAFMAAAVIITALRRLPTTMPVASSCSLAIAAACHHPDNTPQPDASAFPLQWGVMWRQREESGRELTNHCGFSQYPVERPEEGVVYR